MRPLELNSDECDPDGASFALSLAHDPGQRAQRFPVVIALHARGGDAAAAVASARAAFGDGPDIIAPQAARPCNPFQSNFRGDAAYAGFSWYLSDDPARPEAASFGDTLAQLDLLSGKLDRPFVLSGAGQGAVLAVALALYAPPGLVGVHAAGAAVATIEGWQPPATKLPGVRVLLIGLDEATYSRALAMLEERAAHVQRADALTTEQGVRWLGSLEATSRSAQRA